jgi:hypothetical protein
MDPQHSGSPGQALTAGHTCIDCGGRGNVPNIRRHDCPRFQVTQLRNGDVATQAREVLTAYRTLMAAPPAADDLEDQMRRALVSGRVAGALERVLAEIDRRAGAL